MQSVENFDQLSGAWANKSWPKYFFQTFFLFSDVFIQKGSKMFYKNCVFNKHQREKSEKDKQETKFRQRNNHCV